MEWRRFLIEFAVFSSEHAKVRSVIQDVNDQDTQMNSPTHISAV